MKDYRMTPACRGIEPVEMWVVSNIYPERSIPMLVQGFLGAFAGRPDEYWCPEVGFTTARRMSKLEAVDEALTLLEREQAYLERRAAAVRAVLDS